MNNDNIKSIEKSLALAFNRKNSAPIKDEWDSGVMRAVRAESDKSLRLMNENSIVDYYESGAVWAFSLAVVLIAVTMLCYIEPQKSKFATNQIKLDESEIIENIILQEKI